MSATIGFVASTFAPKVCA